MRVQRESVRRIAALNGAMQELSAAVEPEEVKATAARLIAVLASPAGHVNRRGLFLQVEDGWVRTVAGYDALILPGGFAHGDYLRPGADVMAKIYCGRRSLGYVWFHDVINFIHSRVLFKL